VALFLPRVVRTHLGRKNPPFTFVKRFDGGTGHAPECFEAPVLKEGGHRAGLSLDVLDHVNLLVFPRRGVPSSPERSPLVSGGLGPRLGHEEQQRWPMRLWAQR
jgi:hypothetical protein